MKEHSFFVYCQADTEPLRFVLVRCYGPQHLDLSAASPHSIRELTYDQDIRNFLFILGDCSIEQRRSESKHDGNDQQLHPIPQRLRMLLRSVGSRPKSCPRPVECICCDDQYDCHCAYRDNMMNDNINGAYLCLVRPGYEILLKGDQSSKSKERSHPRQKTKPKSYRRRAKGLSFTSSHDFDNRFARPVEGMCLNIPLGNKRHQAPGKVIESGKVADAKALALEDAEPLLHEGIIHEQCTGTKWHTKRGWVANQA